MSNWSRTNINTFKYFQASLQANKTGRRINADKSDKERAPRVATFAQNPGLNKKNVHINIKCKYNVIIFCISYFILYFIYIFYISFCSIFYYILT